VPKWRKGFYNMAIEAKVPIVIAAGDFKNKTIHLGKQISVRFRNKKLRKHNARIRRLLQNHYSKISRKMES
jgi:uncharacterized protein (UPF0261 family)